MEFSHAAQSDAHSELDIQSLHCHMEPQKMLKEGSTA